MLTNLMPEGFLTVRGAAEKIASALYAGEPDRSSVTQHRAQGFDVADGEAIDDATSKIWNAVDRNKVHALIFNATRPEPMKVPSSLSKAIPLLRSPRGGNLAFLRHRNPSFGEFVSRFGSDLGTVSVVFRETEINRLARILLQARRRKISAAEPTKRGRPSRRIDVKPIIREIVEKRKWLATQSLKTLTREVNRRGKWPGEVSDETISRALGEIHSETGDRRFDRFSRAAYPA
jgi:hypothetical protein